MIPQEDQSTQQTPGDGTAAVSRAQQQPCKTIPLPTVEQVLSDLKKSRPPELLQVPGPSEALNPKEDDTLFLYIQSTLSQESFDLDGGNGLNLDESRAFVEGLLTLSPLERVRVVLEKLWRGRSVHMVEVAELLAMYSREESRRRPLGQSGILEFFLGIIALEDGVDDDVLLHSLRMVGNSCADTDDNREIVVRNDSTAAIMGHLLNPTLVAVAVPVLYNICMDFEPAQSQGAGNNLTYILLKLINDGVITDETLLELSFELIEMTLATGNAVESSLDGTIVLLMELAAKNDVESPRYACLVNCLTAYLQTKRFQDMIVSGRLFEQLLAVLDRSFSFTVETSSPEGVKALAQLRLKINQALAEVSATPEFLHSYPVDSNLSRTLTSWLVSGNDEREICACLTLGNLARSDEVCRMMVRDLKLHEPLIRILQQASSGTRGAVLHAALGFLKNLAIVSDNRTELGRAGVIPAIAELWSLDTVPQVQFLAVSLARQVIVGCVGNVARLLESPAETPASDVSETTYLSLLLSLYGKTDSVPIQTEIGRTIASVCRTIIRPGITSSSSSGGADRAEPEIDTLADRFFQLHRNQGVARPLGAMVSQTQWPVVRSEGLFALALMASASSKAGSGAVVDCLNHRAELYKLLEEILTSQGGGEEEEEKSRSGSGAGVQIVKDRENTVVLVKKLLENESDSDSLPCSWKSTMEEVLRERIRDMGRTGST